MDIQDELKKKRKAKKIKLGITILCVIIAVVLVLYFLWGRQLLTRKASSKVVKIEVGENQSVRYARIDAINGNEVSITYLMEQSDAEAEEDKNAETNENSKAPKGFDNKEAFPGGEAPEGFDKGAFPGGEAPEGFDKEAFPGGEAPEGFDKEAFPGGEAPEGFDKGAFPGGETPGGKENGEKITVDGRVYLVTEETEITYIPVGTVVTTKLGTETTFSRLQAGDYIAIVTENNVNENGIVAIYIVA